MKTIQTAAIKYSPKKELKILDQTLLPEKSLWIAVNSPEDMRSAIKSLKVRGANLTGVSAAFALAEYALKRPSETKFISAAGRLKAARPTAIHLRSAVNRVTAEKSAAGRLSAALNFYEEDKKACERTARNGAKLIKPGDQILTYCNTGALAAGGGGTALGVIKQACKDKKNIHVVVCETRPAGQGARLTAYELKKSEIPFTLICDNTAAALMAQKKINKVFAGADRISRNGDTANKIGTLNLAVLAKHFKIPFYIAAAESAFDKRSASGRNIPIEQRPAKEVSPFWAGYKGIVCNPAFDITPASLITAIITEEGIKKFTG